MDTTSGSAGEQRGWMTEHHATPGLQVVLLKKTYVFPWSQFLYAEGTAEEVRVPSQPTTSLSKAHSSAHFSMS
jgi:hypothetical protein